MLMITGWAQPPRWRRGVTLTVPAVPALVELAAVARAAGERTWPDASR
jgi:hypothetical protein